MLRAVELETGKKLWFTHKPVLGREEAEDFKGAASGTAFIVKNGDRFYLFAETGEFNGCADAFHRSLALGSQFGQLAVANYRIRYFADFSPANSLPLPFL